LAGKKTNKMISKGQKGRGGGRYFWGVIVGGAGKYL